jgi:AraC-like DNA-binding protein
LERFGVFNMPSIVHHETQAWGSIGSGWMPLFGRFAAVGVSFEWHDFQAAEEVDWGRSFHPESVEICLNLTGTGIVRAGKMEICFAAESAGFYRQGLKPLHARRLAGERHQFITAEYSAEFIRKHFGGRRDGLHSLVRSIVTGNSNESGIAPSHRLRGEQQQLARSLRNPPVYSTAEPLWYESKALELAAMFFYEMPTDNDLFCDRQKQLAQDRCDRVIAILNAELETPPGLEELGKRVGCSHFYLSRTFSKEMGMTIAQYLRKLRMEKAARLLKTGKFNVTQAALEVGYSSLSHFSQAFHEMFGCCPGLYGIAPNHLKK